MSVIGVPGEVRAPKLDDELPAGDDGVLLDSVDDDPETTLGPEPSIYG